MLTPLPRAACITSRLHKLGAGQPPKSPEPQLSRMPLTYTCTTALSPTSPEPSLGDPGAANISPSPSRAPQVPPRRMQQLCWPQQEGYCRREGRCWGWCWQSTPCPQKTTLVPSHKPPRALAKPGTAGGGQQPQQSGRQLAQESLFYCCCLQKQQGK